ncbi:HD-GYP domain-containing protein [Candidatus Omnitrophota bacterium]
MSANTAKIKKKLNSAKRSSFLRLKEFTALYEVNKSITSSLKLTQVLSLITKKACQIMQANGCSLRLLRKNKKELTLQAHYGLNKRSHLRKGNLRTGESIAGRVLQENRPYIVRDLFSDGRYKHNFIARKENLRSLLSVPLVEKGRTFGVLSIYSEAADYFRRDDAKLLAMFASQAAVSISNARLYERAKANYLGAIRFLANALDAKDRYTAGHSERVAEIASVIAQQMRLTDVQRDVLQHASYLHDLGKVSISINILRKPEKLSKLEWQSIIRHPQIGANIINKIGVLSGLVPIILHHHARYAGGGYPDKDLKFEKIPICSRILSVADAYEAMISHRPYRKAFSSVEAFTELKRCSGTQFDPLVINAFLKAQNHNHN